MAKKKKATFKFAAQNGVKSVQRQYQRLVLQYQKAYEKMVQAEMKRLLPKLKRGAEMDTPETESLFDEKKETRSQVQPLAKDLDLVFERIEKRLESQFSDTKIGRWVSLIIDRIDKATTKDVGSMVNRKAKNFAEVRLDDASQVLDAIVPELGREMNPFYKNVIDNNIDLIKDISKKSSSDLKKALRQALVDNRPVKELQEIIKNHTGKSKSRARMIARDQVGKLNGTVNKAKQRAIGIEKYVWRTVNDSAVRTRHEKLDGRTFNWDDPPVISNDGRRGHPGDDFQCRCYAEPVLDD